MNDIKKCLFDIKNMLSTLVELELKKKNIDLFDIKQNISEFSDDIDNEDILLSKKQD